MSSICLHGSCVACRSDDLGAAQRAEGDQQAASDSAGSVGQELLTGVDVERVAENSYWLSANLPNAVLQPRLPIDHRLWFINLRVTRRSLINGLAHLTGVVSSLSSLSTTKIASSFAGSVLLALRLTGWLEPGVSKKLSPAR